MSKEFYQVIAEHVINLGLLVAALRRAGIIVEYSGANPVYSTVTDLVVVCHPVKRELVRQLVWAHNNGLYCEVRELVEADPVW